MKFGVLAGCLAVVVTAMPATAAEGTIDVASEFSVAETADRMERILTEKGITVFNRVNHSEGAANVGIELRDTELIVFGNPKVGSPLMQCQQTIALDLPQKVLVWQDESDRIWVSYNDPRYLATRHELSDCEDAIATVEKALAGITRAATSDN
ncbi:MAG: DUF302 domain-containing protein [Cyanobacteria bacterium J06648_11]